MALSTKPYKGARDFYPEDKRLQKYMFNTLRYVAERYGYEEYDAPILEPLEIYQAKSGEEIVNDQTYTFEDRGGRQVVIRPEMTPTVSRMVAARRQELAYPLRWYSIPNLWRYERPQRGRLREHWQLNVDIFGVKAPYAELEMLTLVDDIFQEFGAERSMYSIKVNDRALVNHILFEFLGLDEAQAQQIGKLIDRMHKIERSALIAKIDEILTADQRANGKTEQLLAVLGADNLKTVEELIGNSEVSAPLNDLLEQLHKAGIQNATYDPTIMRGFDYYTGIVFEVFDTHPDNNRSMLGGGRYDGLVGLFGAEPVPTVGFGWGDVTLSNFLELHSLLPFDAPRTDVYVALIGDTAFAAQPLIRELRENYLAVAVDYSGRKIGDQIKAAAKKQIPWLITIGEAEIQAQKVALKHLDTGKEFSLKPAEASAQIRGIANA
jgi:histidyl-tRNA synthetase